MGPLERTVILGVKLEAAAEFVVKEEEEEGDGGEEGEDVWDSTIFWEKLRCLFRCINAHRTVMERRRGRRRGGKGRGDRGSQSYWGTEGEVNEDTIKLNFFSKTTVSFNFSFSKRRLFLLRRLLLLVLRLLPPPRPSEGRVDDPGARVQRGLRLGRAEEGLRGGGSAEAGERGCRVPTLNEVSQEFFSKITNYYVRGQKNRTLAIFTKQNLGKKIIVRDPQKIARFAMYRKRWQHCWRGQLLVSFVKKIIVFIILCFST